METRFALTAVWRQRARSFRKESLPYIRYMMMSGFPTFLSLLLIASAIGYFSLINDLSLDFPIASVGVAALTIVISWSPLRTYLAPADTVYLMPREYGMNVYLKRSYHRSFWTSTLLAAAVLLLYLPMYTQGESNNGPWLLALAVFALKAGNAAGGWQERKMAWPLLRRLYRAARWLLTALTLAVWLSALPWQAVGFTLLCSLLAALCYSVPRKHHFPWEQLIEEERNIRRRYYTFFSMFIDVPVLTSSIARRSYMAWVLPRIPYSNRNAFVYLFSSTLIRSEIGGILLRITLLGGLVGYWTADAASLAGWGAAFVYGLFAAVFSLQLSSLRSVHRYSVWKFIYPLPYAQQTMGLMRVDRTALSTGLMLLLLPPALPLIANGLYLPLFVALAASIVYIWIRPARLRRKLESDAEEE